MKIRFLQAPQSLQEFLSLQEIKIKEIDSASYYDFSLHILTVIDTEIKPVVDLVAVCILHDIKAEIETGIQHRMIAPNKFLIGVGTISGVLSGKELKELLKKVKNKKIYKSDNNYILSNIFSFIRGFI